MKPLVIFVFLLSIRSVAASAAPDSIPSFTRWVDPYIGTGFHGHVFMGANVPFGAVQLGPVNRSEGWDWCSGYHYSDSTIIGFSHTHLSGTGIGDLGDIMLMPATGIVNTSKGIIGKPSTGNTSLFSHKEEVARPGYYSVRLQRYNITAELTASTRVGFHRYRFPATDSAYIVVDLAQGIGWDKPMRSYIRKLNDSTIEGYRFSKGWAADQRIYFVAQFSKPFTSFDLYKSNQLQVAADTIQDSVKAVLHFATASNEAVMVKVGISPVSTNNARQNIQAEIPGWNFEAVVAAADSAWNQELGKVAIKTTVASRKKIFYTSLYHTMVAPSVFNDHNGDYFGTDKQMHQAPGFTNLTTLSLWDIYRAAAPLYTVLHPERVSDLVNSMLAIYQQQGRLPVWHLMGNETNTMPGNSAIQLIADAYLKGFTGFDTVLAYEAVKTTAMQDIRGLKFVKQLGFIPADSMIESVAMGLEYAIGDACIAQMARRFNKPDDVAYFSARAAGYRYYFDSTIGFARGRVSANNWRTPFSPFKAQHMKDDFCEGNAWQYSFLVPQDVEGLIRLQGGDQRFIAKLDALFTAKGEMGSEASADITGLIGQYAHGNEPSHHITYLYTFAGQPWKTASKLRYILDSLYAATPEGICGNEDVGQMSAWYVWSALGMYPVHPANGLYVLGSPVVDDAVIKVAGNKQFHIAVKNNSANNKYIQRVRLNGRPYTKAYLLHNDIMRGGELIIEMGPRPSASWGVAVKDRPHS
ncbi:MAG TPA: GH92 family glycosyl hydrolase [Chitinophagaceae bacterium]|nr:GH92 family glycosyl hydrolase [Chitinophagaceae bacterium]